MSSSNGSIKSVLTIADSPMSPPPTKKARLEDYSEKDKPSSAKMNRLDLWRKKTERMDLRALPQTLKLYPHIRVEDKSEKVGKDNSKRDRDSRQDKSGV